MSKKNKGENVAYKKESANVYRPIDDPSPEVVLAWLTDVAEPPSFVRFGIKVLNRAGATMVCRLTSTDPIGIIRYPTPTRTRPLIHIYNHLFRTMVTESGNDKLIEYVQSNIK